jgi:transcriptional regulator with XRE-family HTH domain
MKSILYPAGDVVTTLRKEKCLTQEELAAQAGVDRRTIQRLEKGQRVNGRNLSAVADILGVSPTSLYGRRGVAALLELAEEMTCRYCGAPLTNSGSTDYENVDVDYELYACGAQNGVQFRPCPMDPRFPAFSDYAFNYFREGGIVYCYARGTTDIARSVALELGFGRTQESAAKFVQRSFIAAKDGYEAAEAFYPLAEHR